MGKGFRLRARFLGKFCLCDTEGNIIIEQTRNNKSLHLLEYLIFHHDEAIGRDKLIELLCHEDDIGNPGNTLKIIIHRARRLLEEAGLTGVDSIIYARGKYQWNNAIFCELDSDRFISLLRGAEDCADEQTEINLLREAIQLYRGSFLEGGVREAWARSTANRFRTYYVAALSRLSTLYAVRSRYDELLQLLENALGIYGDSEDLHYLHVSCLHDMGRESTALSALKKAQNTLNTAGNTPMHKLTELELRIKEREERAGVDLMHIKDQLTEEKRLGAFYCQFPSFCENYRYVLRTAERSGQELQLFLCTLTDEGGQPITSESRAAHISESLHAAIKNSLRSVDIYTRYSAGRFLILQSQIRPEDCSHICNRIISNFTLYYRKRDCRLQFEVLNPITNKSIYFHTQEA